MTFDGSVLYAIAESPKQQGVIWTGSNDGQVNITKDGGRIGRTSRKIFAGLPPWGTVMNVQPSHFDAGTAYIAVDLEQVGDYAHLRLQNRGFWRDAGRLISGARAQVVNSSAKCIMEDPVRKGMLYLGTNNGLYVSWDDGDHWTRLRNNLPPAPVYWIEIEPRFHDLLWRRTAAGSTISTTSRRCAIGIRLQSAMRISSRRGRRTAAVTIQTNRGREEEHVIGENPPYGADLNFYLQEGGREIYAHDYRCGGTSRCARLPAKARPGSIASGGILA